MSRYQDKPLEELRPIVEHYLEQCIRNTGVQPNLDLIANKLLDLAHRKEEKAFHELFEGQTVKSLKLMVMAIDHIREEQLEAQASLKLVCPVIKDEPQAPWMEPDEVVTRKAKNAKGPKQTVQGK